MYLNMLYEKNEMGGTYSKVEERRSLHRVLAGKPEGKGQLGIHRCRWEDNIKIDLQEVVMCWYELDRAGLV
jgi:hypothetical protein